MRLVRYSTLAAVALLAAACSDNPVTDVRPQMGKTATTTTTTTKQVLGTLIQVSPSPATATVAQSAGTLVAKVVDARSKPLQGAVVTFSVVKGGGSLSATTATTDAMGQASISYTYGTVAGEQWVQATHNGQTILWSGFATATPATTMTIDRGNDQTGDIGTTLPYMITVTAKDQYGNPASSVPVSFSGNGNAALSQPATNVSGTAEFSWQLGQEPGPQYLTVTIGNASATVTATAVDRIVSRIDLVSGDGQTAAAGSPVQQKVVVRMLNKEGMPVQNVLPMFDGDGSASNMASGSDANGYFSFTWTLGPSVGSQALNVVAGNGAAEVHATAVDPRVASIVVIRGQNQEGFAGYYLPQRIYLRALTVDGYPVAGASARVTCDQMYADGPGGNGRGSPATGVTDGNGEFVFDWMLGFTPIGEQTCMVEIGLQVVSVNATALTPTESN